jgi:ribosomal protein S12 methylthiotransferase accessory factor YcaO
MTAVDSQQLECALASLRDSYNIIELPVDDCPVFLAVALPLTPVTTGLKPRLPAGRGMTRQQAFLSAAAEATELAATLHTEGLPLKSDGSFSYVTAERLADGNPVEVMAQEVFLDWANTNGENLISDADSSGCAASVNLEDATNRALLECIERDAFAIWWYGRQSRQHFPLAVIDNIHPRLSWWLEQRSRKTILIDISTEFKIPVVAAVSCAQNGSNIAIGTAAASNTEAALLSAVTEMIQMEVSMKMGNSPNNRDLNMWVKGANICDLKQFAPLPNSAQLYKNIEPVLKILQSANTDIIRIDLSRPDKVFSVVRIIAPQLCRMKGRYLADRIIKFSANNPEFCGATRITEFENLEPY